LGGTTTVAAVNGVATFSTLTLDKTGTGYWLTVSATGVSATTSTIFAITPGPATQLVFGTQPATTVAGRQITPAVKVRALDAFGNIATGFSGTVAMALGSNPGGATLSGTPSVAAVNGIASFDLSVNRTGTGYTLVANATGFAPVTSAAFAITPGTATQLAFTVQPSSTVAGAAISPAVLVSALDPAGNFVPGSDLAKGFGPLLVGVIVASIGLSLGGPTGYAINPARDLGPRIAHAVLPIVGKGSSDWGYAWIPIVGPTIGGVLGAVLYRVLWKS
jgi:glycerol uptake facilitator-like aquaporin